MNNDIREYNGLRVDLTRIDEIINRAPKGVHSFSEKTERYYVSDPLESNLVDLRIIKAQAEEIERLQKRVTELGWRADYNKI